MDEFCASPRGGGAGPNLQIGGEGRLIVPRAPMSADADNCCVCWPPRGAALTGPAARNGAPHSRGIATRPARTHEVPHLRGFMHSPTGGGTGLARARTRGAAHRSTAGAHEAPAPVRPSAHPRGAALKGATCTLTSDAEYTPTGRRIHHTCARRGRSREFYCKSCDGKWMGPRPHQVLFTPSDFLFCILAIICITEDEQ